MLPDISGARTLWVLGVWFATWCAVAIGSGSGADALEGYLAFVVVVASIPVLVGIHELGHIVGAKLVGFRITEVKLSLFQDAYVAWEAPAERDTRARRAVFTLGGAALALLATAALLLLDLQGLAAGWRAGLITFSVLWTADVLAPLPRPGFDIQRDGYVLALDAAESRAQRGQFGPAGDAQLATIDAALLTGDIERAHDAAWTLLGHLGDDQAFLRAAVLARLAIADLVGGRPLRIQGEAAMAIYEAIQLSPEDPIVQRTFLALMPTMYPLGDQEVELPEPRSATDRERRLLDLLTDR